MANIDPDKFTTDGREIPDPTPLAPPVGYKRQPSIFEQVRNMVRSEALAYYAEQAGVETFEEADDFEVGDDYDPSSPYENEFDPTAVELKAEYLNDLERLKDRYNLNAALVQSGKKPIDWSAVEADQTGTEAAQPPKSGPA